MFLESKAPLVIFRGGVRSGKTRVAAVKAVLNAMAGRKQLFMSVDYPQARDAVVPTFMDALLGCTKGGVFYPGFAMKEGVDFTFNKTDMDLIVRGTYIHMRSAERMNKLRGISAADAYIDESRDIRDKGLYNILIGRMSDEEDGQVFITSSPRGKDWTWDLSENDPDCHLIVQKTKENPFLGKGFIPRLRANYSDRFQAQEIDAEIVTLGGVVIDSTTFRVVDSLPDISKGVRHWDPAVSTKTSADFSAGALCLFSEETFCIADIKRGKWSYGDLKKQIIQTAKVDGKGVVISIEQAGQQHALIDDLKREPQLRQYVIKAQKPRGNKVDRCGPWVSRAVLGAVKVVRGAWIRDFFGECDGFTTDDSHRHDDQIDSVSGAFDTLTHKAVARTARVVY